MATSLLDEFAFMSRNDELSKSIVIRAEVSSTVYKNLSPQTLDTLSITVRNRRPTTIRYACFDLVKQKADTTFVVFGPYYFPTRCKRLILGYADVTSLYPPTHSLNATERLRKKIRTWWSHHTLRLADEVIVETTAVAERVSHLTGHTNVSVVPNSFNRAISTTKPSAGLTDHRHISLAYVTRDYPHKNLEFLPQVRALAQSRGCDITFLVTLRKDEWESRSEAFRLACHNFGEVTVEQLGCIYEQADGAFFPSLLEAQSATPLEAMALGLPLFASDRDFNRAVCGDAAWYFDPRDPQDACDRILEAVDNHSLQSARQQAGLEIVKTLPTARDRAQAMIDIITGKPQGRSSL